MSTLAKLHQRVGRHVVVLRPGLLIVLISVQLLSLEGEDLLCRILLGAVVAICPPAGMVIIGS